MDDGLIPLDFVEESTVEDETWPAGPAPLLGPFGVLLLCMGLYGAFVFSLAMGAFLRTPISDQFGWILRAFALEKDQDWLGYLWTPHGNQRIVFARLLTWMDLHGAGRGVSSFLISTLVVQWLVALAGAGITFVSLPNSPWRAWLAALVGATLTSVWFLDDTSFGNFSVYVYAAGFAVLAILAFALRGSQGWRRAMLPLALGLGVLAMFGNAAGLAVWPALAFGAVRARAERTTLITVLVVGLATIVAASAGLGLPAGTPADQAQSAARHLLKMASYFFGYLALPWASGANPGFRLLGVALAAVYAMALLRGPQRLGGGVAVRAGLDMIAFAVITAALAALGRVDELVQPIVPVRYVVFAMAGQAGLLMALTPKLAALAGDRPRAGIAALSLAFVLVVANHVTGARYIAKATHAAKEASAAFDRGDRSRAVVGLVYPHPEVAADVRAELKRRGLPY